MTKEIIENVIRDFITRHEGEESGGEFILGDTRIYFLPAGFPTLVIATKGTNGPTFFIEIAHLREVRIHETESKDDSVFFNTHLPGTFVAISSPAKKE